MQNKHMQRNHQSIGTYFQTLANQINQNQMVTESFFFINPIS